jgi:hypothetical protein
MQMVDQGNTQDWPQTEREAVADRTGQDRSVGQGIRLNAAITSITYIIAVIYQVLHWFGLHLVCTAWQVLAKTRDFCTADWWWLDAGWMVTLIRPVKGEDGEQSTLSCTT